MSTVLKLTIQEVDETPLICRTDPLQLKLINFQCDDQKPNFPIPNAHRDLQAVSKHLSLHRNMGKWPEMEGEVSARIGTLT